MNSTLLQSDERDATTHTLDQITSAARRGVMLLLDITGAPEAEDTLTVSIEARDPVTGKYVPVTAFAATKKGSELEEGASLAYVLYPGAVETTALAGAEVMGLPVPSRWRATVTHTGEGAWTYSLGCLPLS